MKYTKVKTERQLYYYKDWEISIMILINSEVTAMQWLWKLEQKIICDENV